MHFGTLINLYDVLIVGGGPIGLRVAQRAAEAGFEVNVLEKDRCIGTPVLCAGLVSPRVVAMTKTNSVIDEFSKATIHPPNSEELVLEAPESRAFVLDRAAFDKEMAKRSIEAGAEIELGCKAIDTKGDELVYLKDGFKGRVKAKMMIGADGPSSIIRRVSGLSGPREIIPGIQAVVGEKSNGIHIYIGNEIAPGFFAWSVPHTAGTVYGLGANDGRAYEHLINFLKSKSVDDKVLGIQAGSIPLGVMDKTVGDGLMLVGDAACQVKPLSGGGLYTGLVAADHCADVLIESLETGNISAEFLEEYHRRWQRDLKRELSKGLWMRRIYCGFSDKELDKLFDALRGEKILDVIGERGDIDYPSALAKSVLKTSPKLLKFAGPLIKNLF